jgi:hypothetical protein
VYRAVYHCSGNCRHGGSEEDEGGSDADGIWEDMDQEGYVYISGSESETPKKSNQSSKGELHQLSVKELNNRLNEGAVKKGKLETSKCSVKLHVSRLYFDRHTPLLI